MKKHKMMKFAGSIRYISRSPHGEPEGVVLDDGTFVKVPPHTVRERELFTEGATISGEGELLREEPNRVIHHARLQMGATLLADDGDEAPAKDMKVKGTVAAIGAKPKGEVDRIIFDDGTSVHVPKHVELSAEDFAIGDRVEVEGEVRAFTNGRFVKAESVRHL